MTTRSTRLVIFAKAPQPGNVKTRLIPLLGAVGAAQLARRMLAHTLTEAVAALTIGHIDSVELCMSPPPGDPAWGDTPIPSCVTSSDQGQGDLGARMARAVARVTAAGEPQQPRRQQVLLIGTDCPTLTARHLGEAARQLQRHDAVLLPATDGGYVLLGLKAHCPPLFTDMAWSTAAVASSTRMRLALSRRSVWQGPTLHDIDEPADLHALPPSLQFGIF